jgi:hypothetical protein
VSDSCRAHLDPRRRAATRTVTWIRCVGGDGLCAGRSPTGSPIDGGGRTLPLQTPQRNAVFQAITGTSLPHSDFTWADKAPATNYEGQQAVLMHRSGGAFHFIYSANAWMSRYRPGDDQPSGGTGRSSWQDLLLLGFYPWLRVLKREGEAVDLWEQLERENAALAQPAEAENTLFTADERAVMSAQLRELKDYIVESNELTAAQQREVEARLQLVRFRRRGPVGSPASVEANRRYATAARPADLAKPHLSNPAAPPRCLTAQETA